MEADVHDARMVWFLVRIEAQAGDAEPEIKDETEMSAAQSTDTPANSTTLRHLSVSLAMHLP